MLVATSTPHYQSPHQHSYFSDLPIRTPFNSSNVSSMPNSTATSNPTVRIHQSSPAPSEQQQSMLAQQGAFVGSGWNEGYPGAQYLNAFPKNHLKQHARYHKRASSGSSIASAGPPSPHDRSTVYPHIATSDNFSPAYDNFEYLHTPQSAHTSKSLPTPTGDSPFMYQPNYGGMDMRRIHSTGADDNASYAMSAAPSVSSMSHNSPATPHTNFEVEYDDSKGVYQAYPPSAAYQQSLQDVFPDTFAQSAMAFQQPQQQMRMNGHIPSRNTSIANRLHAAQQDHLRTASPVTSNPRGQSPFKPESEFMDQLRVAVQPQRNVPTLQKTRTSVSPKELMYNDRDIDDMNATPLFADQQQSMFANRRQGQTMANYYTPNFGQENSVQIPQQYPFVSQQSRQESSRSGLADQTPDFPSHLASMESTIEEGSSEPSSQHSVAKPTSNPTSQPSERPDTSSDAGTYSCTYHGCLLRFDSPTKLQKHKREGHRQVSPTASPSASLALRNSQAGPHKCERTNPSTGKPCNSIFSRPYDLTRHEDTIHNARKQKVRCHLCTEEKTFSRNDALTRHMRVVHPDIEWPGKQKRRNAK